MAKVMTWKEVDPEDVPPEIIEALDALVALDDKGQEIWWVVG